MGFVCVCACVCVCVRTCVRVCARAQAYVGRGLGSLTAGGRVVSRETVSRQRPQNQRWSKKRSRTGGTDPEKETSRNGRRGVPAEALGLGQ